MRGPLVDSSFWPPLPSSHAPLSTITTTRAQSALDLNQKGEGAKEGKNERMGLGALIAPSSASRRAHTESRRVRVARGDSSRRAEHAPGTPDLCITSASLLPLSHTGSEIELTENCFFIKRGRCQSRQFGRPLIGQRGCCLQLTGASHGIRLAIDRCLQWARARVPTQQRPSPTRSKRPRKARQHDTCGHGPTNEPISLAVCPLIRH